MAIAAGAAIAAIVAASGVAEARRTPEPTALDAVSPRVIGARSDCSATGSCTVSWELARLPVKIFAGPTPGAIDRSAPVAVVVSDTEVTLPDPDPDAPRYFEIVPRGAARGPVVGDRFLGLEGAPNSRDLGGYLTADGRQTRWGRLFRNDGLDTTTDADRTRLTALGLPAACPGAPDGNEDAAVPVSTEALAAAAASVTSRESRARARTLLLRLARGPLPQWVQCTVLDDRLGWSTALVLATLGVPMETIIADQLLGTRVAAPPLPDRRPIDVAFTAVKERYRSWGRYLGEGLGLDQRTYDRLRARYVTDR